MTSIVLLANPDSGDGRGPEVEALLRDEGAEVTSLSLAELDRAAESHPDRYVVAGGDGSIACVAAVASRAGVPLGVVPTGTANDFAAATGIPEGLEEACTLAVRGEGRRAMELAFVEGRSFVNVASIGLSPAAAENASELKSQMGPLAYTFGAIQAGVTSDPVECRVSCDGEMVFEGEAWQVSIGSTGAFGGGSSIESDTTDGKLDLVVIEAGSRMMLVARGYGLRQGEVEQQDGVTHARCTDIELRLGSAQCLNIDGELIESAELGGEELSFRCERDAFELITA